MSTTSSLVTRGDFHEDHMSWKHLSYSSFLSACSTMTSGWEFTCLLLELFVWGPELWLIPTQSNAKQTGKHRELISNFPFLCFYFAGSAEILLDRRAGSKALFNPLISVIVCQTLWYLNIMLDKSVVEMDLGAFYREGVSPSPQTAGHWDQGRWLIPVAVTKLYLCLQLGPFTICTLPCSPDRD